MYGSAENINKDVEREIKKMMEGLKKIANKEEEKKKESNVRF